MNSRTIALFLTASWLLMVPPPKSSHGAFITEFNAPLSQWVQFREFEQQSQCEETLARYKANPPGNFTDLMGADLAFKTMQAARCLPTGDPQLQLR